MRMLAGDPRPADPRLPRPLGFSRDPRRRRPKVTLLILVLSTWPLSAQPTARVSGRLTAADGRRLVSAAVMLTGADDSSTAAVPPEDVTIFPDGRFTFGRVPPGRYQIRARAQSQ